jgi:hypothetical protein
VRENKCIVECGANLYFKDGSCVACDGVVSEDYKDCKACPTDGDKNQYFDKDVTKMICTECKGKLEAVDKPTECTECTSS